ncbi:hypothetical protein Emed_006406 [Eimeria media]
MPATAATLWGRLRRRGGPSAVTAADLLASSPAFACGHSYPDEGGPRCLCSVRLGEDPPLPRISRKESVKQKLLNVVGDNSSVSRWINGHLRKKQQQQEQQQEQQPLQQQQQQPLQQQQPAAAAEGSSRSSALRLQFRRFLSHTKEAKSQGQDEGQQQQQPPHLTAAQPSHDTAAATAKAAAAAKATSLAGVVPQEQGASTESAAAAAAAAAARETAETLAAKATQQEEKTEAAAAAAEGAASALNPVPPAAVSESITNEGPLAGAPEEAKRRLEEPTHERGGSSPAGAPCCLEVTTKAEALGGGAPRAIGGPLACLEGLSASRAEKLLEAGGVADVVRVFLSVVEGFFGEALLDQP